MTTLDSEQIIELGAPVTCVACHELIDAGAASIFPTARGIESDVMLYAHGGECTTQRREDDALVIPGYVQIRYNSSN